MLIHNNVSGADSEFSELLAFFQTIVIILTNVKFIPFFLEHLFPCFHVFLLTCRCVLVHL